MAADHYLFCADGSHENPDLRVLEALAQALDERQSSPAVVHFNYDASTPSTAKARAHMNKVEKRVAGLQSQYGGRVKYKFHGGAAFTL